jgi:flagellar hook-associated protein 3 FlgL
MRVTDKMTFDRGGARTGAARSRLEEAIGQVSSGLKVEHAWDDPSATAPVVAHRLAIKRFESIEKVARGASDELVAADNAMSGIGDAISRARELAVQLSNDTYSAADRAGAAAEIRQIMQHTVGQLNTQVGNRYIFGGNLDNTPPFTPAGTYNGDTGVRSVEVFPGVLQEISVRGDQVALGVGLAGGVNVLGTLGALATALETNNLDGVRGTLDSLDQSVSQISLGRSKAGAAMNTVDVAASAARASADSGKGSIAGLTEVDLFESASRMALAERGLEAAISATSRSFDLTLLKKLG